MEELCVVCGKEPVFSRHICRDCFLEKHVLVKLRDKVPMTLCYFCNASKVKRSWMDLGGRDEAVKEGVRRALEVDREAVLTSADVELDFQADYKALARVLAVLSVDGGEIRQELTTLAAINYGVCDNCSRAVGNYYEAVLQVRAEDRPLFEDEREELSALVLSATGRENRKDPSVFISKVEESKNGLDYFMSSSNFASVLAKRLVKAYGAKTKQSAKLVGRREGRDMYRTTVLIRLPNWRKGDVVWIEGRYYAVVRQDPTNLTAFDLLQRRNATFKSGGLKGVRVHRKEEVAYRAVLVSSFRDELTLLDPVTMQTRTLVMPKGYELPGDGTGELDVYRIEDELLLA